MEPSVGPGGVGVIPAANPKEGIFPGMEMSFKHWGGMRVPIRIINNDFGGASGDDVIMIESEGLRYILKVYQ